MFFGGGLIMDRGTDLSVEGRALSLGLARTIYIWCMYDILNREFIDFTVKYGACI